MRSKYQKACRAFLDLLTLDYQDANATALAIKPLKLSAKKTVIEVERDSDYRQYDKARAVFDGSPILCKSVFANAHWLTDGVNRWELNCKSWRCPIHRAAWRHKWIVVVNRNLQHLPVNKLINLTTAEFCPPSQLALAKQLFCRQMEFYSQGFDYFSVLEYNQKKTQPHMHMLCRVGCSIPDALLSQVWASATVTAGMKKAYIVWQDRPQSQEDSLRYVLKYSFAEDKNQDVPDSWKGRKITYSNGFFHKPVKEIWQDYINDLHPENVSRETPEIWVIDKPRVYDYYDSSSI